ncbi:iron complex outermembrane receptor protein/outer membrane receptor for ferric coprogen and ferric-rhodotorulic acid [Pseudomonas hunanensis]|uniref:Iron complex outermembrane receptor protein/outer membrane receptor for ferric coprogen and ferric-rhodotorulic acid n=1 Tax=Pseudomonas hunanensis TaxID=1247546 RepID=A0ACC6K572_9PSED|nr:TonB-dependent siderophore receptor [Pseudomonas hunanensis]MDR6713568.1 iron complex outermembrane receptor protein/outer membrane receptor for ferric coprogen and ferric-rhodotorulic acid [Pseudomonas hunanensis]
MTSPSCKTTLPSPGGLLLATRLALGVLPLALPVLAHAQAHVQPYDIPAGPLEQVLGRYAQAAGAPISVQSYQVAGLTSLGIKGSYSVIEGFAQVLRGTGLSVRSSADGYVVHGVPGDTGALEVEATTVSASVLGSTTEGSGSYTTGETAAATRMNLSLRQTPQSLTVVTRQQMDDQNLQSVSEVMKQTPGITVNQESSEAFTYYSRGFKLENYQFDGVPSLSSDGGSLRDNYSIGNSLVYDRVEVLKGATGLVNGSGNPSGVINLVRKRPTEKFQGRVGAGAGSWDKYTADVDLSGPLTNSGHIRGRMVAGTQSQHSYVDYLTGEQNTFYGVIEADLSDSTLVTVGYDVQKNYDNGSTTGSLPAFYKDGRTVEFDRSTNAADRWTWRNQETQRAFAELAHTFDNEWVLKGVLSSRDYRSRELISGISSEAIQADGRISHGFIGGNINPPDPDNLAGTASKFNTTSKEQGLDLYARGPFSLGGRVHEAVFGYSIARTESTSKRDDGLTNGVIDDVFQWNGYGDVPTNFEWWSTFDFEVRQRVGFAATVLKPTDAFSVILGARIVDYKWDIDTINAIGRRAPASATNSSEIVPYVGVTYDLDQFHTVYASYTDIFKPQAYSLGSNGTPIDPLTGESYEIGLKGAYFQERLNASLALFELKQDNLAILSGGLTPEGRSAYRAAQGVTTRGVELEVAGEVMKDLQLMAGYTFAESHDADGKREATNQPQHLFKLATNYRLPGDWHKVTVGGNVYWQSSTFFKPSDEDWYEIDDPTAKFEQKSYTLVGLVGGYDFTQHLKATVNVNNLFDKHYYSGIGNYGTVFWGAPRNVMFNVKYSF